MDCDEMNAMYDDLWDDYWGQMIELVFDTGLTIGAALATAAAIAAEPLTGGLATPAVIGSAIATAASFGLTVQDMSDVLDIIEDILDLCRKMRAAGC